MGGAYNIVLGKVEQKDLYKYAYNARLQDFGLHYDTELDSLKIDDVDADTLELYHEYQEVHHEDNFYMLMGFFAVHNIKIKRLLVNIENIRISITEQMVYVVVYDSKKPNEQNGVNRSQDVLRLIGINPDHYKPAQPL